MNQWKGADIIVEHLFWWIYWGDGTLLQNTAWSGRRNHDVTWIVPSCRKYFRSYVRTFKNKSLWRIFWWIFGIVSEEIRRLKKYLKKENSVCIWFSKKDADEYLGMLAFTNYRLYQLLESGKLILVKQGVVQQGIYGWAKEFFKSIVKISNWGIGDIWYNYGILG